jgi:transcription factor SPN1
MQPSNGALPSVNVRTRLLEALQQLPCGREHLIESGIGKTIMLLWKHPDETKHNRDLCAALVERWSRPIFELNNDYSALAPATFDTAAGVDASADNARRATSLTGGGSFVDVARADERIELHPLTGRVRRPKVRVPQPLRLNFDMQPASKVEQRSVSVPSEKKKVMMSHLNSLKKKKSNFKRAQHVAITKLNL